MSDLRRQLLEAAPNSYAAAHFMATRLVEGDPDRFVAGYTPDNAWLATLELFGDYLNETQWVMLGDSIGASTDLVHDNLVSEEVREAMGFPPADDDDLDDDEDEDMQEPQLSDEQARAAIVALENVLGEGAYPPDEEALRRVGGWGAAVGSLNALREAYPDAAEEPEPEPEERTFVQMRVFLVEGHEDDDALLDHIMSLDYVTGTESHGVEIATFDGQGRIVGEED